MIFFGLKTAYAFFSIPIAFYLQAMFIQSSTSITIGEFIRIVILEGFHGHIILFVKTFINIVLNQTAYGSFITIPNPPCPFVPYVAGGSNSFQHKI
jgi:hypothetical protein